MSASRRVVLCCVVLCRAVRPTIQQASSLLQLFLRPTAISTALRHHQQQQQQHNHSQLPGWVAEGAGGMLFDDDADGDDDGWGCGGEGYSDDGGDGYNAGKRECMGLLACLCCRER